MLSSSKWAVIYFTCVDLGPDTNGGALCCRNHVIRLAADPAIKLHVVVTGSPQQEIGNRLFVEAVLWIARTGSPWRDLPELFGKWNTIFKRSRDWVKADVFKRLFDAVSEEPDMEYVMVDATIVKVHRHGQGAKGGLRARP